MLLLLLLPASLLLLIGPFCFIFRQIEYRRIEWNKMIEMKQKNQYTWQKWQVEDNISTVSLVLLSHYMSRRKFLRKYNGPFDITYTREIISRCSDFKTTPQKIETWFYQNRTIKLYFFLCAILYIYIYLLDVYLYKISRVTSRRWYHYNIFTRTFYHCTNWFSIFFCL